MFGAVNLLLAGKATPAGPPTFDSAGAGYSALGGVNGSYSHDIAGNFVAIFGWVSTTSASSTITATVGGQSATSAYDVTNGNYGGYYYYEIAFYLLNPPTGSQTIAVDATSIDGMTINSVSCNNVTTVDTALYSAITGTALTASVSSSNASNLYLFAAMGANGASADFSSLSGATSRYSVAENAARTAALIIGDAPGNGSTLSMTATANASFGINGIILPVG